MNEVLVDVSVHDVGINKWHGAGRMPDENAPFVVKIDNVVFARRAPLKGFNSRGDNTQRLYVNGPKTARVDFRTGIATIDRDGRGR